MRNTGTYLRSTHLALLKSDLKSFDIHTENYEKVNENVLNFFSRPMMMDSKKKILTAKPQPLSPKHHQHSPPLYPPTLSANSFHHSPKTTRVLEKK